VKSMEEAMASVKSVEITRAVRNTQIKGLKIKKGQAIGVIDDKDIVAAGPDTVQVLLKSLAEAGAESSEVMTVYYGTDIDAAEAEATANRIRKEYPEKQVEMVRGGQPFYSYIVSVE